MEELYLTITCYNGHHDLCLLFMGSGLSVALGQELPWLMNFHMNENTAKEQGWEPKGGMHTFHNHLFLFILQENLRTYDADRWWYFLAGLLGFCYKAAFHLCNCKVITWFLKEMHIAIHLAHIPFSVWNSNELTLPFLCESEAVSSTVVSSI